MERITKGDVETAAKGLNDAARALGLDRMFIVWFGSQVQGTSHELAEEHPGLLHPTVTKIGTTYAEAERYLRGMAHALQSAKRDRDYRAEDARSGDVFARLVPAPVNSVGIFDPDAREHRRQQEDLATRPPGADQ